MKKRKKKNIVTEQRKVRGKTMYNKKGSTIKNIKIVIITSFTLSPLKPKYFFIGNSRDFFILLREV